MNKVVHIFIYLFILFMKCHFIILLNKKKQKNKTNKYESALLLKMNPLINKKL